MNNKHYSWNSITSQIDMYNQFAGDYKINRPAKSLYFAQKALLLASQIQDTVFIATANNHIGEYYLDRGEFQKALHYFHKSLSIIEHTNEYGLTGKSMSKVGAAYYFIGQYENAETYGILSLGYFERVGAKTEKATAINMLSYIENKKGNHLLSLRYLLDALELRKSIGNENEIAKSLNSIGDFYLTQQNTDLALLNYRQAYFICTKNSNLRGKSISLNNIGVALMYQNKFDLAKDTLLQALDIKRKLNLKKDIAITLENLGRIAMHQNQFWFASNYINQAQQINQKLSNQIALISNLNLQAQCLAGMNQLSKAIIISKQAIDIARKYGSVAQLAQSYKHLSDIYMKAGDAKQFMASYKVYSHLNDSLETLYPKSSFFTIQQEFETKNRQTEIDIFKRKEEVQLIKLKSEASIRNILVLVITLIFVFSIILLISYQQKRKLSLELDLRSKIISKQNASLNQTNKELGQLNKNMALAQQKLIESNQTKDRLFSIISHDLRSPLATLSSFLNLITRFGDQMTMPEMQKMAIDVQKSLNNLSDLLDNLLKWAQVQMNFFVFEPEQTLLINHVNTVLELFSVMRNTKQIEVKLDINPNLNVWADTNMLEAILRNLISNALKFTPVGGIINIKVSQNAKESRIVIKDSGVGMPEELIKTLFIPAKNTSRQGTQGERGTALGLLICKDFVDCHDGILKADSQIGNGSEFVFTLPQP